MVYQTYIYFTKYRSDKTWTKTFVACIFFLDTLNTIFDFAYLYDSLIVHFDDASFLARADWLFATDPAMTAIIASLVQLFFAWRVKVLTGKSWLMALVGVCALTGLAGGLGTSIEALRIPLFMNFMRFKTVVIVWLVAECIADILITTILESHKNGLKGSDVFIDRIIRSTLCFGFPRYLADASVTVQTGLATTICAMTDLVLYLINVSHSTGCCSRYLIFNVFLAKLYTNSLLSSLNARAVPGAGSADSGNALMTSKRASMPVPPRQFQRSSVFIDVDSIRTSDMESGVRQEVV
ncbi:hypothetical protein B0H11DRAFT_2676 [Mycena galericulata]|nr:hypothetical protein B0H11DRAFT_2676 [Mycena galericulata]